MTYEKFKDAILTELIGYFPPDTTISIQSIPRNNQQHMDGLTILESGFNVAPILYLEDYYEKLQDGVSFKEVLGQLRDTYFRYRPEENMDLSILEDFSYIRGRIVYKLIHYERNRDLLSQVPHIPFLDLAIVFYCLISAEPEGNASILIHNNLMELWNVKCRQLFLLARKNTPALMEYDCSRMSDLLRKMMPQEATGEWLSEPFPMYVLSNRQGFYGAACLLYDKLLENLSAEFESDFYIIPSSIHEVILIPAIEGIERESLDQMVRDVNATHLSPDEILSDHVYYYDRQTRKLSA